MNFDKPIIVGNWKMNQPNLANWQAQANELAKMQHITLAIAPPFTMLADTTTLPLLVGGQNCHFENSGAHTGDISTAMLASCGAKFCIVGHSERRQNCFETSEIVKQKANACLAQNLTPIICIGESKDEYEAGLTNQVLAKQLQASLPDDSTRFIVAYEPIWAIGTGLTPSLQEIANTHTFIRDIVERQPEHIPLLYGGSVNADNIGEIIATPNVNGVLVGGASLDIIDFLAIAKKCSK